MDTSGRSWSARGSPGHTRTSSPLETPQRLMSPPSRPTSTSREQGVAAATAMTPASGLSGQRSVSTPQGPRGCGGWGFPAPAPPQPPLSLPAAPPASWPCFHLRSAAPAELRAQAGSERMPPRKHSPPERPPRLARAAGAQSPVTPRTGDSGPSPPALAVGTAALRGHGHTVVCQG